MNEIMAAPEFTPGAVGRALTAAGFAEYDKADKSTAGFHLGDARDRGEILAEVLGGLANPPYWTPAEHSEHRALLRQFQDTLDAAGYQTVIEDRMVVITR